MIKKILGLMITAVMILSVSGTVGCDNISLNEYKATKSQALQDYANAKGESNYNETGWAAVCKAVTDGKAAIETATTKPAVTTAFNDAKDAVDVVEREEMNMKWVLCQFDLTEPKIIWQGTVDDDFTDDIVLLTLKKTSTYPELQLSHFGLDNAIEVEYVGGVRPPDYFFTEGYEQALDDYRQIVFIHILPQGKDEVVKTIRELEKIDFIRSVSPNNLEHGG